MIKTVLDIAFILIEIKVFNFRKLQTNVISNSIFQKARGVKLSLASFKPKYSPN